jgi:hypothetical protein
VCVCVCACVHYLSHLCHATFELIVFIKCSKQLHVLVPSNVVVLVCLEAAGQRIHSPGLGLCVCVCVREREKASEREKYTLVRLCVYCFPIPQLSDYYCIVCTSE